MDVIATGRYSSIDELLNNFHIAAAEANLNRYFGCFSSPTSRFLGTDASENWSALEFYDFSKPHFESGQGWTFIPIPGSRKLEYFPSPSETSNFAYFDELLESRSFLATSRGSGCVVYDLKTQSWFIFSYHLSFPIPNDLAKGMCLQIHNFEKKSALKAQELIADAAAEDLIKLIDAENSKVPSNVKSKSGGGKKK